MVLLAIPGSQMQTNDEVIIPGVFVSEIVEMLFELERVSQFSKKAEVRVENLAKDFPLAAEVGGARERYAGVLQGLPRHIAIDIVANQDLASLWR